MRTPPDGLHPASDDTMRVLSQPGTLRVLLALNEAPVTEEELALALRIPMPELVMRLAALEDVGLVALAPQGPDASAPRRLHARHAHLQHGLDGDGGSARLAMRRGMLHIARMLLDDGDQALESRGQEARAGIGVVTLPDEPAVLLEAARIMAEAEDKLRVLARDAERRPDGAEARIALLILPAP